jgi:hypothetical protein
VQQALQMTEVAVIAGGRYPARAVGNPVSSVIMMNRDWIAARIVPRGMSPLCRTNPDENRQQVRDTASGSELSKPVHAAAVPAL